MLLMNFRLFKLFAILSVVVGLFGCAKPRSAEVENQLRPFGQDQAHCFSDAFICLQWNWIVTPTETQPGTALLETFDLEGSPMSLSELPKVTLRMVAMDHRVPRTKTTQNGPGSYQIDRIFFIMRGPWQIIISTQTEGEVILETVF